MGADITEEPKLLAKLDLKKQTVFLDFNLGGQTLVMLKGLKNGTSIAGNYTLVTIYLHALLNNQIFRLT